MSFPLIGLTTYNSHNQYGYPIAALMHQYLAAVTAAGGMPMLIPCGLPKAMQKALMEKVDGILFTGGGDIAVERYGGERYTKVEAVDSVRDQIELDLTERAVRNKIPFLGICRGCQVVNVALGGSLYTHIPAEMPTAIKHDYDSGTQRELLAHDVNIEGGTHLAEICGTTNLRVNSLHHQGVKLIASKLEPCAYAPDGLVEGLELPNHPFGVAVQWHPEWLINLAHARRLFAAFIEACRR